MSFRGTQKNSKRTIVWTVCLLLASVVGILVWFVVDRPVSDDWVIPQSDSNFMRAVHMSGNWGGNVKGIKTQDEQYFEYLRDLNVNWVGLSVALHVDDSMDATVERVYTGVEIPTFIDEDLERHITHLRKHGFHVYLTLAFEDQE